MSKNILEKNSEFKIKVFGNPTTGYHWNIDNYDNKYILFIKKDFILNKNKYGEGGEFIFFFKTKNKITNSTKIKLIYKREWLKEYIDDLIYEIKII